VNWHSALADQHADIQVNLSKLFTHTSDNNTSTRRLLLLTTTRRTSPPYIPQTNRRVSAPAFSLSVQLALQGRRQPVEDPFGFALAAHERRLAGEPGPVVKELFGLGLVVVVGCVLMLMCMASKFPVFLGGIRVLKIGINRRGISTRPCMPGIIRKSHARRNKWLGLLLILVFLLIPDQSQKILPILPAVSLLWLRAEIFLDFATLAGQDVVVEMKIFF
jgi:hypothetical protein